MKDETGFEDATEIVSRHVDFVLKQSKGYELLLSKEIRVVDIFARIQRKAKTNVNDPLSSLNLPLICMAAIENHTGLAGNLIARGASLGKCFDKATSSYRYPYEFAAERGYFEMVDLLVKEGAKIDPPSIDLLEDLRLKNEFKLLIKLIKAGTSYANISKNRRFGFNLLVELFSQHQVLTDDEFKEVIDKILPALIDPDSNGTKTYNLNTIARSAVESGVVIFLRRFLKLYRIDPHVVQSCIELALKYNRFDVLKVFIGAGIDLDISFILTASAKNKMSADDSICRLEVLFALSQKTGFVDIEEDLPIKRDLFDFLTSKEQLALLQKCGMLGSPVCKSGITLMHWAAYLGNQNTMKALIQAQAPVVVKMHGSERTPLHIAVMQGHVGCAELLIKYPALIRCRAITLETVFGSLEESAFETALRLGFTLMIELFINSNVDTQAVVEQFYSFISKGHNLDFFSYFYFSCQFRELLFRYDPLIKGLSVLKHECEVFIKSEYVSPKFLEALEAHQPFIRLVENMGYKFFFGDEIYGVFSEMLNAKFLETGLKKYGENLISDLQKGLKIQEANRLKRAFLALDWMFKVYKLQKPLFLQEAVSQIDKILQVKRNVELQAPKNFKEDFDEKDGMILVGTILSEEKYRKQITTYCQDAYKCGLTEGCDFRMIGMDDNLASLCVLVERDPEMKKQLDDEISRKIKFINQFHKKKLFTHIASIEKTASLSDVRKWENALNLSLLLWFLSKQEKVKDLLGEKTALSELKKVDLIATLLESD